MAWQSSSGLEAGIQLIIVALVNLTDTLFCLCVSSATNHKFEI